MNPQLKEQDGRYYQECEVVMIATENSSTIFLKPQDNFLLNTNDDVLIKYAEHKFTKQHIYILSNGEIKEGDWVLDTKGANKIYQVVNFNAGIPLAKNGNGSLFTKKIIATTDWNNLSQTSRNEIPKPPNSFIQKYIEQYNKGEQITKVLVEYEYRDIAKWARGEDDTYDCFVCGKENFYREDDCNCQFYYLKTDSNNHITIKKQQDSWSREELKSILNDVLNLGMSLRQNQLSGFEDRSGNEVLETWIKENI